MLGLLFYVLYIVICDTILSLSELGSCVKVEVAVLGSVPNKPSGFCGRTAPQTNNVSETRERREESVTNVAC